MKMIIDIPDQLYETCKRLHIEGDARPSESAIANGVPDLTKSQAYDKGFITAMKLYSRQQGEWIVTAEDNEGIHRIQCPFCRYEKGSDFIDFIVVTFEKFPPFCENCGAQMVKGGAE